MTSSRTRYQHNNRPICRLARPFWRANHTSSFEASPNQESRWAMAGMAKPMAVSDAEDDDDKKLESCSSRQEGCRVAFVSRCFNRSTSAVVSDGESFQTMLDMPPDTSYLTTTCANTYSYWRKHPSFDRSLRKRIRIGNQTYWLNHTSQLVAFACTVQYMLCFVLAFQQQTRRPSLATCLLLISWLTTRHDTTKIGGRERESKIFFHQYNSLSLECTTIS